MSSVRLRGAAQLGENFPSGPPVRVEPYLNEYVKLTVEKKTEHLLHCSIRGNPSPSYYWFSGDVHTIKTEAIISNQIDFRLTPNENYPPGSKPTVTCIAKNNRGTQRQVFILQLEVWDASRVVV